jgi:hypothetical protein
VQKVLTRDVYGKALTFSAVQTEGKIELSQIELIESGSRVSREGARIMIADKAGLTVTIGSIISEVSTGLDWTVVGIETSPDHQGFTHYWKVDTIRKATDVV